MIGRVRKMLCFQAERSVQLIRLSTFAFDRSVQEISAVKLDSWLVRQNLQHASTAWIIELGGFCRLSSAAIQYPVVIVSTASMKLFIVCADTRSNCSRLAKIERSPFHGFQLSRRNQSGIHGSKARGVQRELMVQNVTLACQIE